MGRSSRCAGGMARPKIWEPRALAAGFGSLAGRGRDGRIGHPRNFVPHATTAMESPERASGRPRFPFCVAAIFFRALAVGVPGPIPISRPTLRFGCARAIPLGQPPIFRASAVVVGRRKNNGTALECRLQLAGALRPIGCFESGACRRKLGTFYSDRLSNSPPIPSRSIRVPRRPSPTLVPATSPHPLPPFRAMGAQQQPAYAASITMVRYPVALPHHQDTQRPNSRSSRPAPARDRVILPRQARAYRRARPLRLSSPHRRDRYRVYCAHQFALRHLSRRRLYARTCPSQAHHFARHPLL